MYWFYKNYLSINLADYKNIKINLQINIVLLCLLIGVIVAAVFSAWHRNSMILLFKMLYKEKCTDENGAKTLSELGINKLGVRTLIRMSGRTKRLICRVGMRDLTYEEYLELTKKKKAKKKKKEITEQEDSALEKALDERIDFATARFYLKDADSQQTKLIPNKIPSSVLNTVLMCLLLVSVYTIILFLMPTILEFINNILAP